MLFSLEQVLANRPPLITIRQDASMLDAFQILIDRRIGQIPVIDETGRLRGIVSQQSILRTYYHTDGIVDLLDLPVLHCMEAVTVLHMDDDLFVVANVLAQSGQYAPVVVEEDKPIAILTGKDMTHFFRSLFEGIILVERIETRLREYVSQAFPDTALLEEYAL